MVPRSPPTVATCGSVNVDITAFCERLPRPGETVMGRRYTIALGGKGANQAVAVSRLGGRSIFVGRTGTDAFGALARRRLAELGVELDHLASDPNAPTGVAVIDVDRRAENSIIVIGGANLAVGEADVDAAKPALQLADALLLQLETPLAASLAAARLVRAAAGVVILDPAPAPIGGLDDEVFRAADVISPNETETETLVGILPTNPREAAAAASRLLARGAPAAIIKMGARGVYYRDSKSEGFVPLFSVRAVNSVGAGDCFNGGLAMALARGDPLADAVRFAAACGALATTGPGGADSAPTLEAVERLMGGGG
ncbi:MAG: ribokinase [Roseiarcus sp.]|jgi:ribokinase